MRLKLLAILALPLILQGCALPYPAASDGLGYKAADERLPFGARTTPMLLREQRICAAEGEDDPGYDLPLLSPGDRLAVSLDDGAEFEGTYAVGIDGYLRLPYLSPVRVRGLDVETARQRLWERFVEEKVLVETGPEIGMVPILWAAVNVNVVGAVYSPGPVVINDRTNVEIRPDFLPESGDLASDRFVSAALRAAGGVRPDADLSNAVLIRDGKRFPLDLVPMLEGGNVRQRAMLEGDIIEVPSVGLFQEPLARPSAITAPGHRVFLSNLTIPAPSNAQSAIGNESTSLPTGSRLSHALTSANCIGGIHLTNAPRSALLVSRNPVTNEITSHLYRVYDVTRNADDTRHNPYIMPNDAIACFDSRNTQIRDFGKTVLDVALPIEVLRRVERGGIIYD